MKNIQLLILLVLCSLSVYAQPPALIKKKDTTLWGSYQNGLIPFSYNGKMGVIDSTRKVVLNAIYDRVSSEYYDKDGLFSYRHFEKDGKEGILRKDFGILITPGIYDDIDIFAGGFFKVKKDGKYSYVDQLGKCLNIWFDNVRYFREGLAPVKIDGKWGYIDTKGKMIITPQYKEAYEFYNSLALVKQKSKYGYINTKNEVIIPFIYSKAEGFYLDKKGKVIFPRVKLKGKWMRIDRNGNEI